MINEYWIKFKGKKIKSASVGMKRDHKSRNKGTNKGTNKGLCVKQQRCLK